MMLYNLTGTEHISESWAGVIVLLILFLLIIVGFILFWCFNTPTEDWLDQPLLWTDGSAVKAQDLWQERYLPSASVSYNGVEGPDKHLTPAECEPVKYARSAEELHLTSPVIQKSPAKRLKEWMSQMASRGYRNFRHFFVNEHEKILDCPVDKSSSGLAVVCDADFYSQPFSVDQSRSRKDGRNIHRISMSEF
ncbi:uncharacterized protein LOC129586874 [Paramacrobiotus metropolitanus]|uniref:uncharacterized protein LOC129586874 n=1 Tax=Paramacrobiotus metropolitanus TaxID=2943436 RepID=UPI002445B000|nr:uncharacterized protein LOC129586874 [Paramacrobiotus metropolitanus]